MNLPSYFTNKANGEYSKTIKAIVSSELNDSSMIRKYGYGLLDLAVSLQANRPNGLMQLAEYRNAMALNNSVKRFIKLYSNKK